MTKAPELKPCPFCGGTPEIEIWTEFDRSYPEPNEYQRESVSCTCGVQRNGIEAWNQRADLAPVTPAQAAVDKIQTRLDELDRLCANAERRGPSYKGYVTDATYNTWCGERHALAFSLRAISEGGQP